MQRPMYHPLCTHACSAHRPWKNVSHDLLNERMCASVNHFHNLDIPTPYHFCSSVHQCFECEAEGNCDVQTELVKKTTSTFNGQRMVFEFVSVSEQTPVRKMCNIPNSEFKEHHEGAHSHSQTENVQHNCELPMGHLGLHQTTHGNMRGVHFVSESEDIDICERKFLQMGRVWGSRDVCNDCRALGPGHIHLLPCHYD